MKISKVNHSRTAVANNYQDNLRGFIYKDPGAGTEDLTKRLDELNRTACRLYNVFAPIQVGNPPKEPKEGEARFKGDKEKFERAKSNYDVKRRNYERKNKYTDEVESFNNKMNHLLFEYERGKNGKPSRAGLLDCNVVVNNIKNAKKVEFTIVEIEEFVSISLRKSLYSQRENVICILSCMGKRNLTDDEIIKIQEFVNFLKNDYGKLTVAKDRYIRSIENQNMPVQPKGNQDNNSFGISVPAGKGKKHNYKTEEIQGLSSFLLNYATLDSEKRDDYLRRLRRIVDLYFSGPDILDKEGNYTLSDAVDTSSFCVWDAHEKGKNREGEFVAIPKELTDGKAMDSVVAKKLKDDLCEAVRRKNINCYRYSMAVISNDADHLFFEKTSVNKFWVHHIENSVERILGNRLIENASFKLKLSYLTEKVWKDIINYLSVKYITIGKAVFNFGMEDLGKTDQNICLGQVPDEIKEGIFSFDYEMIKAKETFQRETAVSVMFAANNLARATVDLSEKSDFLLFKKNEKEDKENDFQKYRLAESEDETLRCILQFFGGMSTWDTTIFEEKYGENYAIDFLDDIRKAIYQLRNESFHFVAGKKAAGWDTDFIGKLFEIEAGKCLTIEKDKFYSNNLPMFYHSGDLKNVLNKLYSNEHMRASQVPAFNNVVVRKNLPDFLDRLSIKVNFDSADKDKWQSALYYLFKEVYYNDFIQSKQAKELFNHAVSKAVKKAENDEKNIKNATNDFSKRIGELYNSCDLAQICQSLMTEYNYQNNKRTVRSGKDSLFDKEIFKHYKKLLYDCLSEAFAMYIEGQTEVYGFIKKPAILEMKEKSNFLADWKSDKYKHLIDKVKDDSNLQAWYVIGHFLNARMLNQLAGSMKSFIQYVESINRRAKNTKNNVHRNEDQMVDLVKDACSVIETCIIMSSTFSNEIGDYFKNQAEYIEFLSQFTSIQDLTLGEIFYNKGNVPIVNRNVVIAKLYAPVSILKDCVEKFSEDDILKLQENSDEILSYKTKNKCSSKAEQLAVLEQQKLKNKVELRTLVDYAEVINELLGQLVNWSYLRERDLLYFQLGFHYMCLNNKSEKHQEYGVITHGNGVTISGAILHQIAALYMYNLNVFYPSKDDITCKLKKKSGQESLKEEALKKFSLRIIGYEDTLLNAGRELFDVRSERDAIRHIRNYIDHFKYYNCSKDDVNSYSLLDLYSEVFDRFFTYDMKYQKNVPNMLYNILLRHNIISNFAFGSSQKYVAENHYKSRADIKVAMLESDIFTYKFGEDDKEKCLEVAAKNEEYLKTVAKVITYPKSCDIKTRISEPKVKSESGSSKSGINKTGTSKTGNNFSGRKHNNRNNIEKSAKKDDDKFTYNPFEALLK